MKLGLAKKILTWLLVVANTAGVVFAFTHGASSVVKVLIGLAATCAWLSAVGIGWNTGKEVLVVRGRPKTIYRGYLDLYFPPALILSIIAVCLYLWA